MKQNQFDDTRDTIIQMQTDQNIRIVIASIGGKPETRMCTSCNTDYSILFDRPRI
ncbi:MAG: hypothetical protein K8Q89_01245 [Nitrosarchaeum sp.]|nr:hypothetical protein [Nitrosarchaeum sp.]